MDMCLLCLEMRNGMQDIIKVGSKEWQEENIEKLIEKYFWAMKYITCDAWLCTTCWQCISEFHKFYTRIEDAHAYYTPMLKVEIQDELDDCGIYNAVDSKTNKLHNEQVELELPMDQAPEIASPNEEEIHVIIKGEVQIEDEAENEEFRISPRRRSRHTQGDPLIKASTNNSRSKTTKKQIAKKETKTSKKPKFITEEGDEDDKSDSNSDSQTDNNDDVDYNEGKSRLNLDSKSITKSQRQDEFVSANFKLNCGICQTPMKTFLDICKHSSADHKQRGFVTCCKKKFFSRGILVDHIHWHLDPEYFKCNDCGKVMVDRRCLNIHARVHEQVDRIHICDVCGKDFARPLALRRHKITHLPDEEKKFSCGQCDKNFGDLNFLAHHIRCVHLNKYALVCDICGHKMRSKGVFERHMLKHEGLPLPTVSCDVCGLKMTDPRSLKRHKEIQHPEGERIEYKCHVCSKISPSLKAHKKHVQYKHVLGYNYKCTMCDKAFKRSISLTEHMAAHTGTVLYTCPYCPKTFNSNSNLHSHRKKSHPKEWEEACRAKYSGNLPPNFKPATIV